MDARRRKLPGRQCVTEDFLLFGGLRALGLGVQGGGEAVVLVQRVFHISGEFGAYGFRQFVLYPVEVALRGLGLVVVEQGGDDVGIGAGNAACAVLPELDVVVAQGGVSYQADEIFTDKLLDVPITTNTFFARTQADDAIPMLNEDSNFPSIFLADHYFNVNGFTGHRYMPVII